MRVLAVVAGGVLYALALPPFDWWVCAWFALVPLLWAVRGGTVASAFRYGVLCGYAQGWAVTWCFADAASRYFDLPFPLAVAALSTWYLVVCGIPFGCFATASVLLFRSRRDGEVVFLVPAAWVATEWLRGYVIGQPWALLGYTQYAEQSLIQVATIAGVYGVSFLVALGNTALVMLLRRPTSAGVRWAIAGGLAVIVGCVTAGSIAIRPEGSEHGAVHEVAVVQTNVAPQLHWTRAYTDAQVAAHLRASEALPIGPSLIVWPEHSVPRYLEGEPMLAVELSRLAIRHRADLVFGGPRYADGHTYNSARVITAAGRNGGYYDKRRLVLFAEQKPLGSSAHGETNESPEEFTGGTGSGVLQSFVPIGLSICHEVVHPDLTRASVRDGAELLVNIANDGWLDGEFAFAGRQHLAMAVFRAVESRRFLVRAATTGNSAVIDPYGRILTSQPPDTAGIITAEVYGSRVLTPYVRAGDVFAVACALVGLAALPWPVRIRRRRQRIAPIPAV